MTDTPEQIIARAILAITDVDSNHPHPAMEWAARFWEQSVNEPHLGDCPLAEIQGPVSCSRCIIEDSKLQAAALIKALAAAGYAIVPCEPFPEQAIAGDKAYVLGGGGHGYNGLDGIVLAYRAMLKAAP